MKNVRRFSLLSTLVTIGALLPACTQGDSTPPATTTSSLAPPSAPAGPALPYYGVVDRSNCDMVSGWVTKTADPKAKLQVELYIDDQLAETLPAENLREDLANKVGTGRYGFSFRVPSAYKDGRSHIVEVRVAGTTYAVPVNRGVTSNLECKQS